MLVIRTGWRYGLPTSIAATLAMSLTLEVTYDDES